MNKSSVDNNLFEQSLVQRPDSKVLISIFWLFHINAIVEEPYSTFDYITLATGRLFYHLWPF